MKLELNKRYITRNGAITGPLVATGSTYFTFKDPLTGHTYKPDGGYRVSGIESNDDIIDEYPEQSEPLILEAGKRYMTRDGRVTGPAAPYGHHSNNYPFKVRIDSDCATYMYSRTGEHEIGRESALDLVSEYVEQPATREPNLESRILNRLYDLCTCYDEAPPDLEADIRELESRIAQPASDVYDSDTRDFIVRDADRYALVDAAIAYPTAMAYLNDLSIDFIIRDGDQYHVTTGDGVYTINEAGFLFKQIKL